MNVRTELLDSPTKLVPTQDEIVGHEAFKPYQIRGMVHLGGLSGRIERTRT